MSENENKTYELCYNSACISLSKGDFEEAQKIHIRNYIGSGLYNEIISQVQSGSLTALNTTLLDDYIIPALKWWTMVEAAPFLTYKVTNKNIVRKNSFHSNKGFLQ